MSKREIPQWIKDLSREELEKQFDDTMQGKVYWVQVGTAQRMAYQDFIDKYKNKLFDFIHLSDNLSMSIAKEYLEKIIEDEIDELFHIRLKQLKMEAEAEHKD